MRDSCRADGICSPCRRHQEARRQYAKSVDLLVIGSHDYRPIDHLLERSTAQRLAGEASSPLLVIGAGELA